MCLTETQKKISDTTFKDDVVIIENMREKQDKKGGGLMMLYRKDQGIKLTKMQTKSKDMIFTTWKIGRWEINIIMIYFSVNDKESNNEMKKEIERIIEGKDEPSLITGDFNGLVGFIGNQKLDINGKMILDWMEKYKNIRTQEMGRLQEAS